MTDVGISVGIVPETEGARVIKRSLDEVRQSGQGVEKQMKSVTSATQYLSTAFKGLFVAFGAREVIRMADQYTVLNARLKTVAGTTQETTRMMAQLRQISNQTGTEMETSLSILQRLSFVRNEIKATNNDMLAFTETVTKLGVTSGALPEAMKAGLMQLGQALSSQITRAEEFNSIMENIPAVGKSIADELGVTTGQLRLLVVEGKLLSSDVFAAILNQTEKVRAEFEEFPKTASQGFKQMVNSFDQIIAQANSATGATSDLGTAMRFVGVAAKVTYDVIATVFNNLTAFAAESYNAIAKIINLLDKLPGVNFGNGKDLLSTSDVGTFAGMADQAHDQRLKDLQLFGRGQADKITTQPRGISQDYAKIAAGLTGDTDGAKKALKEQKKLQDELTNAVKASRSEQEQLYDKIAEMERLRPFAKTAEQADAISKNIRNARDELSKLAVAAELDSPLAKAFKGIADEVQDGFKDAFKGAFEGGGSMFAKFADGVKATFKSLLLDLAYQATVRPIVLSVVAGIGGAMGLSSNAVASTLGTSSGGGGFGNISSLSGLLNGGLYSNTLGGIGSGIGNLLSGQGWGAMGPSRAAALGGGAFGNLGYGALGGLGASLLGLGSKNAMVNMATGTLGSLAGGAIGSSMGTIFGLAGGPIGAGIGGFLGTALGGLFGGGKPSDMSRSGSINLATLIGSTGGMTGKKFSQQNEDFAQGVLTEVRNLTQLLQMGGGKTTGSLDFIVGNRDGLRIGKGGNPYTNNTNYGNNSTAFVTDLMQKVVSQTTGLNETFQKILDKVGVSDTQKLSSAFSFGQWYENLGKVANPLADAMKALNEQFDAMKKMATDLGFPLDKINAEYDKQKTTLEGTIKAQKAGFSTIEQMTSAFDDFFNGQALGGNSSLNPLQKLQTAQDAFGGLLTKAQGGDLSVTPNLLGAANTLLDVGRNVYASGTDFSGLESFVRSSVQGVAQSAGYSGQNVSYSIISTNQMVANNVLQMSRDIQDLKAEIFRLTNKLAAAA